jgi:hypothetical protein
LLGCSQKTDSGLTKSEIHQINSAVSQQTTSHIMGFTVASNRDVTVLTEKERFLLHRSPTGWVIVTNAVKEVPQAWSSPVGGK